jgi:ribonuclease HI
VPPSEDLELLPPPLRARVLVLRARRGGEHERVTQALAHAFYAAFAGDMAAAAQLVAAAEQAQHEHEDATLQSEQTARSAVNRGLRGVVAAPDQGPVLLATDGSVKGNARRRLLGWGYLSTSGHWGLGGAVFEGRLSPLGSDPYAVAELYGVQMALTGPLDPATPLRLQVDSSTALAYLRRWRSGALAAMPNGYSLRPRTNGSEPGLVRLAKLVHAYPDLTFVQVKGHAGHPLNEAADGLARMATGALVSQRDMRPPLMRRRAAELAAAFLREAHARATEGRR